MATCPNSPVVGGGVGETPVPVKVTTCGVLEALSLAVRVPFSSARHGRRELDAHGAARSRSQGTGTGALTRGSEVASDCYSAEGNRAGAGIGEGNE